MPVLGVVDRNEHRAPMDLAAPVKTPVLIVGALVKHIDQPAHMVGILGADDDGQVSWFAVHSVSLPLGVAHFTLTKGIGEPAATYCGSFPSHLSIACSCT
ncbi:hypothetical protein D3C87_1833590 [compost metagenome]